MINRRLQIGNRLTVSLLAMAVALGLLACGEDSPTAPETSAPRSADIEEMSFAAGETHALEVDNFAGSINLVPGRPGVIQIKATKRAATEADLDLIEVVSVESQRLLKIRCAKPDALVDVAVDLEIAAPVLVQLVVENGAGDIEYEGTGTGRCRFNTGAGSITLRLPDGANAYIELVTGVGGVETEFPVDGFVLNQSVSGIIGTGRDGDIRARTGAGDITLCRQIRR